DMAKLKQIQRLKFTLPVRNVSLKSESTFTNSVRRAIYEFFRKKLDEGELIDTLRWFIFQEYDKPLPEWTLASCPSCERTHIPLCIGKMTKEYTVSCAYCGEEIFLTDVFRLHEAVDDEL